MKIVIIEVLGGVAEVTRCPRGVEVRIIDHDNEAAGEPKTIEEEPPQARLRKALAKLFAAINWRALR